jgi:phenylacetic acid degradation operon negative regulatory protein
MRVRTLVLAILQAAGGEPLGIQVLVHVAEILGLTSNATRVAVSRLVREGALVSDERGLYRVGPRHTAISRHIERFRIERRVAWRDGWLACARSSELGAARTGRTSWALDALGFRPAPGGLSVRPDNLSEGPRELEAKILGFGGAAVAMFRIVEPPPAWEARWRRLWPTRRLQADWTDMRAQIETCLRELPTLSTDRALVEAFYVGRAAVALLAFDPLLPEELVPLDAWHDLVRVWNRFQPAARRAWTRALGVEIVSTPAPFVRSGP